MYLEDFLSLEISYSLLDGHESPGDGDGDGRALDINRWLASFTSIFALLATNYDVSAIISSAFTRAFGISKKNGLLVATWMIVDS